MNPGIQADTRADTRAGMAPLPAALGGDATLLTAWRIDAERFAASWDSGLGAERFGGRWNPKGLRVVYCSLDPATCLVEVAVHRGFEVLDTQPHVLTALQLSPAAVHLVSPEAVPNPAWLQAGWPSAGQQRWGGELLMAHGALVLPSVVSRASWNLLFAPDHLPAPARAGLRLLAQQRLVVDPRLNPPAA
ncbi:RES domain-containing protein (plasmid) [Aquabacterium sp. OR-4]|nr:RES domain-containing protein [Aquabacterium sp. OR-4]MDT7838377.1 RES domain-containing protein [Aquabacterium sp. OR-4]